MDGESHNQKEKENWLVKIIAVPIGIVMFAAFFVAVGIGMPVLFVGSVILTFTNGDVDLLYAVVAAITGYVAWKFWKDFPKVAKEQFLSIKQWFNRKNR